MRVETVRVEVESDVARRGSGGPTIAGGVELSKLPPGPAIAVGLTLAGEAARE